MKLVNVVNISTILMFEDKLRKYFGKIGLKKLEQDCYIALVKKSPQKAADLAKRFGEHKSTILDALHKLTDEYGFVKRSKRKNSYLFLVENVNDLVNYVDREEDKLKTMKQGLSDLIPQLRGMQNYEISKPKIYYFEGKKGIHQALEQVLDEADEYVGYGSVDDDVKYLPQVFPDFYERRVAKKIPVKAIVPALPMSIKETLEQEIQRQRKTHLVPAAWNYNIQMNLYKGTIVFYSYEEGFALMIKSKPIAECMEKIFEMAFEGKAKEWDEKIRVELGKLQRG